MNPSAETTPHLNLPPPGERSLPPAQSGAAPEAALTPAGLERAPSPERQEVGQVPAAPVLTASPLPGPLAPPLAGPASAVADPPATPGATTTPLAADDNDLIEKEWVNKAKEIVERTRENPYQQSKELNLFKADYMQKRYNKTLKLSE